MARIKKYAPEQKLSSFQTFIVDSNPNSEYFRITEFKDTFTGGKNGFLIEGSEYLKESTEIKIDILDVNGDPIYYEPGNGIPEYYEGISKLIAVYIYEDTPIGLGKITILGELKDYNDNGVKRTIPESWQGAYNVKWERTFQINKNLANEDRVRFYRRPEVNITEINKPIFNNNSIVITKSGSATGTPLVPIANTNLSNFSLPTSYRITTTDDNFWTGSIAGQTITFGDINYSTTIDEVVSDTEIIVSPPYSVNNLVKPFTNEDYSVSFNYLEGVTDLATALTGSFAKINITDMKTFVGDAARVKVFRRSQSNLTDYEFVQEIQLESNELLRDIETTSANEETYGNFTEDILTQYWTTSSNDFTSEFDRSFLYNSAKLNSTEGNYFFTSQSFNVQSGVEYTLDFNVRKGSTNSTHFLKATLSGSLNGVAKSQTFVNIPSSTAILQKQNFNQNIIADEFDSAQLYFEVEGDDWYINNVSLKASQETSFSPDEITFIQQVPKTLQTETFDYRFEFYDINNNYIPVLVEETKTFDGGNLNLFNKSITITPNQLYFTFDSASNPSNPLPPYTIVFDIETSVVTGSVNFTSGAYDEFGDYISASEYIGGQYPGLLKDLETGTPTLHVSDFTGSRDDIFVQYIRFTGEVEGVSDSVVISRVQDGKGGVNFEIRPYRGTVIKNKSEKDLEVQAIRIDGINEIVLRDNLPQVGFSDAKLRILTSSVDPTTSEISGSYLLLSEATAWGVIRGVTAGTTGSGEIDYNAVFTRDSIDSELTLYLMDGHTSESILTSLILTDLQDGLDGGYISFDAEQFGIKPRTEREFTPNIGRVTGSFYLRGTNENPISGTLDIYPSMSVDPETIEPTYYMFYVTNSFDRRVSIQVTDFDNNIINSGVPGQGGIPYYEAIPTKQLTTTFTYTEDYTSSSISTDKTFFAVPDGNPGDDAILVKIDPNPVVLNADQRGRVFNYDNANTEVTVTQGVLPLIFTGSKKPGTFTTASIITTGIEYSVFDNVSGDASMSLSGFSNMTDLTASIEYVLEIHPFFTASFFTQSYFQPFNKSLDGAAAINIELEPTVVSLVAEENGGVYDSTPANTTLKVKQGEEYLEYNTGSLVPGTFSASIDTTSIEVFYYSSSKQHATDRNWDDTLHYELFDNFSQDSASIDYTITVYPFSITNGIVTGSQTFTRKQILTKNKEGVKARSVSLETTSQTVNFDGDGVVTSPIGSIFLTATAFNVTASQTYYQFFQDGFAYSTIGTDNTFEIGSGDATSPGNIATWKVEIRDGAATSPVVASSEVTITGIKSGANNYQVFLTNPSPTVRVDVDGTTDYTQTGTQIKAFKGTQELTHVTNYSSPTLDLVGDPIGVLGEFSASIWSKDVYITQPNYPVGNPATVAPFTFWSNPQDNASATIVYKVDIEDGRATYFLSQSISTVFEGQTGPGVVFRGPWTGSIEYIYNKDSKRRDAVLWSENGSEPYDTYYATKDSGSSYLVPSGGLHPPTIGGSLNDLYWESLGQEEFFVAAKIAIFEESFVKNTINVGQPATSYAVNPQITIYGGDSEPYISIGQGTQGYGFQGIFLGVTEDGGPNGTSGTTGLLSIEDNTGQSYLRWDGYNLEVKSDNVLIETDNLTIDSQNEKISIGQGTQGFQEEGIYIGKDNTDYTLSLRSAAVGGTYKSLEWDGSNLTLRGAVRQTDAGVIEPSLRGTWIPSTTYYPNDLVQYLGETWSSNTQHTSTDDTNASTGRPGSGPWTIAAGAGKGVSLLADTYVIAYDSAGNNPTPSGTLNLIASSSNFVNAYFKFTGGGAVFTDETSFTDGLTSNTDTATVTIPSTYFSTPLTFKVAVSEGDQEEKVSDTITITAVQPGADSTPMYFITSTAGGTQIKNGSGAITLQVQKSDSTGLSNLSSGDIKIYSGSNLISGLSGVTGTDYNPTVDASAIFGTMYLTLKDGSTTYDTITLLDVTDGLGGGSFISPNLKSTRNPADNSFTPTLLQATASFFDTSGTEYQGRVTITPSFSGGVDRMAVSAKSGDTEVTITAGDGDGGTITLGGASVPTKDTVLTAVFTDPATGQTTTINETFYIISDGADGIDAITVINTNQAHTLPASSAGAVSSYAGSGTNIRVFEGITELTYDGYGTSNGTWTVSTSQLPLSTITIGGITDNGDDITIGNHDGMAGGTDLVTITYSISGTRTNGESFVSETTQTLTKAKAGVDGAGANLVQLAADAFTIVYDANGSNPSPSSIKLMATSSNFDNGYFKFTGGGAAFTDETSYTDGAGANDDSATFTSPSSYSSTPYTFRVGVADGDQIELVSDFITIASLKPGADASPQYMITPIAGGTQIKNGSGTIELQVQKSATSGLTDVTSGTDARIYDGATLLAAQTGVTDGGNGVAYNPVITSAFITGTKTLLLKDNGGNVLDSITLLDVTDGLGGGSFISPNLKTTRDPATNTYTPTFLSLTASFYDTSGTEYTKAVKVTPNYASGTDYMYYDNDAGAHTDSEISLVIDDGDGTVFSGTGIGNKLPTKDVVVTATFTDPATSQTSTMVETVYIISDGADGLDAITVISTNQAHTLPAASDGTVSSYAGSGTTISVYEGTTALDYDGDGSSNSTWTVSATPTSISAGGISDSGNNAVVADHSGMSATQASITYNISGKRANGDSFTASTIQTLTKAIAGTSGVSGTSGINGTNGAAGTPSGIVYAGAWTLLLPDGSTANVSNKVSYLAEETLKYVTKYAAGGTNYWVCATTHRYAGEFDSGEDYVTNDVVLDGSTYYLATIDIDAGDYFPGGDPEWQSLGSSLAPGTWTAGWTAFGAEFTSVATDILFAQDVYADKTINVGSKGSNAVIALNSDAGNSNANPYISIGQGGTQGFRQDGIFIGFNSGTAGVTGDPKLSLYGNGGFVEFDGTDFKYSGLVTGSSIQGGELLVGFDTTSLEYKFRVTADGNVTALGTSNQFAGSITANAGNIGGWNISDTSITDGFITLDSAQNEISLQDISGSQRFTADTGDTLPSLSTSTTLSAAAPSGTITDELGYGDTSTGLQSATQYLNTSAMNISSVGKYKLEYNFTTNASSIASARGYGSYAYIAFRIELRTAINGGGSLRATTQTISTSATGYDEDFGGGYSVIKDTQITLANGKTTSVQNLKAGDSILAWNEDTQQYESSDLSAVKSRIVDKIYRVTAGGNVVEVSEEHGFYYSFGWETKVNHLRAGEDEIYVKEGDLFVKKIVDSIEIIEKEVEVYTLSVPRLRNYISNDIVSHNLYSGFPVPVQSQLPTTAFSKTFDIQTGQTGNYYANFIVDSQLNVAVSDIGYWAQISLDPTNNNVTIKSVTSGTFINGGGFATISNATSYFRVASESWKLYGSPPNGIGYIADLQGGLAVDKIYGAGGFTTPATGVGGAWNVAGHPYLIKGAAIVTFTDSATASPRSSGTVRMSAGNFTSISGTTLGTYTVNFSSVTGAGTNTSGKYASVIATGRRASTVGLGYVANMGVTSTTASGGTGSVTIYVNKPNSSDLENLQSLQLLILH